MSIGVSYGVMENGVLVLMETCNFEKPVSYPKKSNVNIYD